MARNSKVSTSETLIFTSWMAPLALLVLFITLSIVLPTAMLAQDPPDPVSEEETSEETAREGAATAAGANDSDVSNPAMYRMEEGKFPVLSLMRFIQRTSGKFVNYPSAGKDPAFAEETFVDVVGDVDPLTYPIVQAILETNGYELWESTLDDGTVVINVRATTARTQPPSDPVSPIIEAGSDQVSESGDELATLVLQLKHVETAVVRQALQELLGIQGAGSQSGSLKIVTVTNNETLIIKAKMRVLDHIQRLVEYIDVEVRGPEELLVIRELFYADAQDIVSIVQEALSDTSSAGSTGRRTSTPTSQAGRGGSTANRGSVGRGTGQVGESTRLIADNRTQKILIQSSDPAELDLVHQLIDELDTKVRNIRNTTWIYKVNYLKAEELADNIRQLVEGSEGSLRRGSSSRGGTSRTSGRGTTGGAGGVQQQQQFTPTRIVPHEQTNSLIIQAEPEEYEQIEAILKQIDKRRRQVFLEVALVQVKDSSSLNYTLEFLAGNLDDQALTGILLSSFGASEVIPNVDPNGVITGVNRIPGIGGAGLNAILQQDGQFPLIMSALKSDEDSNILATPFILADDNQENSISVQNEIFYTSSNTTNVNTTTSQQSESAGITLSLIPTISSEVVLLELELEVSSFSGVSNSTGALPDRSTNIISSKVTIPDGGMFIIGGLAQMAESEVKSKVPLLGDLPFIGTLFQSSGSNSTRDNLYVFLSAHILDDDHFNNLGDFTKDAIHGVRSFQDDLRLQQFTDPNNKRDQQLAPLIRPGLTATEAEKTP
ncbi:MAG: hypothetical protein OSB09_00025 [Planctomycetota bacterium]|nr:hypothetical protein [Planctomycetota bacterium]